MTVFATFRLSTPMVRQACCKAVLGAPEGMVCEIKEDARNLQQNAAAHAALQDIADQMQWHGKTLSVLVWKRLTMASFLREIGHQPELLPALDGNGFDVVFERTSKLGKKQFSAWLEWIYAFGTQNGVMFRDRQHVD